MKGEIVTEDKVSLTRKRAELVARLATPMSTEALVCTQAELSLINAKLKMINTTEAARMKAEADRRKVAGLAEAQANAARALAKVNGTGSPPEEDPETEDDDPGQTAAIDGWVDAVLLRHDIDFIRRPDGSLMLTNDPSVSAPMPQNLAAAIELLVTGISAAARGQELPELPKQPPPPSTAPKKTPKPKKR
jgi:hypothetical protein